MKIENDTDAMTAQECVDHVLAMPLETLARAVMGYRRMKAAGEPLTEIDEEAGAFAETMIAFRCEVGA